jgi:type IV pilus assembly protein PilM
MAFNPFKFFTSKILSRNFLGIDIGSSSIKVVEIGRKKGKELKNYGQLKTEYFAGESFSQPWRAGLLLSSENVIEALSSILQEAKIKTKNVFFSIPDYSTFFTSFDLPPMSKEELTEAVRYEAPRHIPLPLADVTLDWEVIKGTPQLEGRTPLKVLLVAVPNETINQYQNIAKTLGLKIIALEAEVFALARALIKYQDKRGVVCLMDLGERSTTVNIVSQNILKVSHSLDVSGEELTRALSETFQIDLKKAEIIKKMFGIKKEATIRNILLPYIDSMLKETRKIFNDYFLEEKEKVEKVILAGGSALLPGLSDYLSKQLELPTEIANPFLDISYPPGLDLILKRLGPEFTIAVGAALRGTQ